MVSINGSHLVEALINGSSSTWGSINGYIVSSRDGGGGERGGGEGGFGPNGLCSCLGQNIHKPFVILHTPTHKFKHHNNNYYVYMNIHIH